MSLSTEDQKLEDIATLRHIITIIDDEIEILSQAVVTYNSSIKEAFQQCFNELSNLETNFLEPKPAE